MYNSSIHNKILLLGYVIDDIRDLEQDMLATSDPSLISIYKEEMKSLIEELNSVSSRCITLLEIYVKECEDQGAPVLLDYVRVLKELRKARI